MAEIISTEDVHLYYGKKEALHGISMNFHENEITALIGPSGCGKSTYLRCINRMNDLLEDVTITGSFTFENQDIYAPDVDVVDLRKKVGDIFAGFPAKGLFFSRNDLPEFRFKGVIPESCKFVI